MNTDICKLLYPSRIYCFSEHKLYREKNYFLLSDCRGHVVLDTQKKIRCKILYSLFHILLVKTSYEEFSNLKRIEKKIEKSRITPIIGFDREDMK